MNTVAQVKQTYIYIVRTHGKAITGMALQAIKTFFNYREDTANILYVLLINS